MALISGTPILLFGADSHKTEALYDMIDYPYLFFDIDCIPLDIKIICDEANKIISDDIRDKLLEKVQKLSIEAEHNADMI